MPSILIGISVSIISAISNSSSLVGLVKIIPNAVYFRVRGVNHAHAGYPRKEKCKKFLFHN